MNESFRVLKKKEMKMKKVVLSLMVGMLAASAMSAEFVSRVVKPTANIAGITNTFADVAIPVLVYTEVDGTTTNAVAVTYIPSVATNAADYGKVYRVGSFSTVGGAEVPIVLNSLSTSSVGSVQLNRSDVLKLTGDGGVASTSVWYRIVFQVK
jgi:hypothetical protein